MTQSAAERQALARALLAETDLTNWSFSANTSKRSTIKFRVDDLVQNGGFQNWRALVPP